MGSTPAGIVAHPIDPCMPPATDVTVSLKIADLSRLSGVPAETIKFYVREGLLPPGESLRANKTVYTRDHLQRLALVRAMREIGGLSIAAIKRIVEAFDQWGDDPRIAFHMAFDALSPLANEQAPSGVPVGVNRSLLDDTDALLRTAGWDFGERVPAAELELADALASVREHLYPDLAVEELLPLTKAVHALTDLEMHWRGLRRETAVEELQLTFLKTILFERVLVALRRLARESIRDQILQAEGRVRGASNPTPSG